MSTSDETNLLSAESVLDGDFSTDFSAVVVRSFRGLLIVSYLIHCCLIALQLHSLQAGTGSL